MSNTGGAGVEQEPEVPFELKVSRRAVVYLSTFISSYQPGFKNTPNPHYGWGAAWWKLSLDNYHRGVEASDEQRGRLLTLATERVEHMRQTVVAGHVGKLVTPPQFEELDMEVLAPVIDRYDFGEAA